VEPDIMEIELLNAFATYTLPLAGSKAIPCGCVPTGMVEIALSALAIPVTPATKSPDKMNVNPNITSNNDEEKEEEDNDLTQKIVQIIEVFN
jgi:hypothetical protein